LTEIPCAREDCRIPFVPKRRNHIYHEVGCGQIVSNRARAPRAKTLLEPVPASVRGAPAARKPKASAPSGWEPGVVWDGTTGAIVSRPLEGEPDWNEQLKSWGFDPALYRVVDNTVQIRTWDAAIGNGETKQMWYYRANIETRKPQHDQATREDIATLIAEARKRRPRAPAKPKGGAPSAFIVTLSDWQAGKRDYDGLQGLISRIVEGVADVKERIARLRRAGDTLDQLCILGLGDLHEACDGFYAQQTFSVELDDREQDKVVRRLILYALRELSPLFSRTLVAAVGGNHGENRKGGKSYTSFGDNRDVSAFETVAEVVAEAGDRFGDIAFVLPREDLTLTLDVAGTTVGLAHGHQATGSGSAEAKIMSWWKAQALGGQPIGEARVLFTGHYHHVRHVEDFGRQWFQSPALEGGSRWWTETQGSRARPGILTAVIDADGARDVAIVGRRLLDEPTERPPQGE
jgi:hypothetical protein